MAKSKAKTPESEAAPAPPTANYTVVARRYRPQQFNDLIGQEHVALALTNAIASGRIAHAYLFTGARGVGKTSSARILAKALNCEKGPTATPCDACDSCLGIIHGNDVDVVEIDGASNNKVDEARELRSNVGFRPTRGRFKIYIIDEVHMLTTGAFNALLKTLEEPPPHVKFILATTEIQKIPITILSRCQRYDFSIVGPNKIFATLKHIAEKEKIEADDDALRIVARRAAGSMRDSQTLLEQLLGACDGQLTAAKVHAIFGTMVEDEILLLTGAILSGDARKAVELIAAVAERGLQLGELLDQLIEYWRGLMLISVGGPDLEYLPGSEQLQKQLVEQATGRNLDGILAGLDILTSTKSKVRGSPHTQVLLEMAAVRLSRLDDLLSVGQLAQYLANGVPAGAIPATSGKSPPQGASSPSNEALKKKLLTGPEVKANSNGASATSETRPFSELWDRILGQMGAFLPRQLQQCSQLPAIIGPNSLVITYAAEYAGTAEVVRMDRNLDLLKLAFRKETGQDWTVRVEVQAGAPTTTNAVESAPRPSNAKGARNALLALPFFQAANEMLGAQLMRADDGFDPNAAIKPLAAAVEVDPDDELSIPAMPDSDEVD